MSEVTIKLTIGHFSVEVSGPQEYVDDKFKLLVDQYLNSPKGSIDSTANETLIAPPVVPGGKQVSPAEFLKKGGGRNQFDHAMLLGYYLEHIKGFSAFTSTELASLAKEAKRPFANASDIVAKLTSRGLMMSSGDKEDRRAYAVTATGEEYVASILAGRS